MCLLSVGALFPYLSEVLNHITELWNCISSRSQMGLCELALISLIHNSHCTYLVLSTTMNHNLSCSTRTASIPCTSLSIDRVVYDQQVLSTSTLLLLPKRTLNAYKSIAAMHFFDLPTLATYLLILPQFALAGASVISCRPWINDRNAVITRVGLRQVLPTGCVDILIVPEHVDYPCTSNSGSKQRGCSSNLAWNGKNF